MKNNNSYSSMVVFDIAKNSQAEGIDEKVRFNKNPNLIQ